MKKYAITRDLYVWEDSDKEAKARAEVIAEIIAELVMIDSENQCSVVSVHDASDARERVVIK